jgi:hypothetical protein
MSLRSGTLNNSFDPISMFSCEISGFPVSMSYVMAVGSGTMMAILLISIPILIVLAIRQRVPHHETVGHQNDVMEIGNGNQPNDETVPTVLVQGQHLDQQDRGRFLGFLFFLVLFFNLLSIFVSRNFFVSNHNTSLVITKIKQENNYLKSSEDCFNSKKNQRSDELLGAYGGTVSDYQFSITTKSRIAQQLFAQGLTHLFAFNQKEAERNFKFAISEDFKCAMCHWGLAAAMSPNLNDIMTKDEYQRGYDAIHFASELFHNESAQQASVSGCPKERLLIEAMQNRFQRTPISWTDSSQSLRDELERSYSHSLEIAHDTCPDDQDIASLYAESLLNLSPWNYFAPSPHSPLLSPPHHTRNDLTETSLKALNLLESLLFHGTESFKSLESSFSPSSPRHPLALHLYLHITEQFYSPLPQNSSLMIIAADTLLSQSLSFHPSPMLRATLIDSVTSRSIHSLGHLLHMPAHAYYRTGLYDSCILSSQVAISTDAFYQQNCFEPYLPSHNVAMLVVCALENGQMDLALSSTTYQSSLDIPLLEATGFMTSMVPWPQVCLPLSLLFFHSLCILDSPGSHLFSLRNVVISVVSPQQLHCKTKQQDSLFPFLCSLSLPLLRLLSPHLSLLFSLPEPL